MKIPVIEKIMKLPQQTEESLNDAFSILLGVEDRKSVDYYLRWVRSEAKKIRSASMYELIRKTYFYAAQYSFDDFMIAMEWNREPKSRFWSANTTLPRRFRTSWMTLRRCSSDFPCLRAAERPQLSSFCWHI